METVTDLLANKIILWGGFNILVLVMLALDLGVFHRKDHRISMKESIVWSIIWVVVALVFNVIVYFWRGPETALQFFTGYLIERSLSIDNIFVFLLIFSFFGVPEKYQYKVLFWGILGALVLRGLFIALGTILISQFHWVLYIFGAFLIYAGLKMALADDKKIEPERNPVLKMVRRLIPITKDYRKGRFFIRENARRLATPLFVVLVVVETTDVVFALDSIPAIFAITLDPFIVYTSNVFAILGLRALYFALAALMDMFYYLKYALGAILAFVGVKMLISSYVIIPIGVALGVIAGLLTFAIIFSVIRAPKKPAATPVSSNTESKAEKA
ncbi:MAG: TerC family protein [Candidatus Zixiibacteriota bacterium]|nr:MAG: TerC family protein [candidate division Zixibacteria bacterium]